MEASGSRSKKLAATDKCLMLEDEGVNRSRERLQAQRELGVGLSNDAIAVLCLNFVTDTLVWSSGVWTSGNVEARVVVNGGYGKDASQGDRGSRQSPSCLG